jgi:hypothetical protein
MISRRGFLQSGAVSMIGLRAFAEETQLPAGRPRALVFDVFGTVVDWRTSWRRKWRTWPGGRGSP